MFELFQDSIFIEPRLVELEVELLLPLLILYIICCGNASDCFSTAQQKRRTVLLEDPFSKFPDLTREADPDDWATHALCLVWTKWLTAQISGARPRILTMVSHIQKGGLYRNKNVYQQASYYHGIIVHFVAWDKKKLLHNGRVLWTVIQHAQSITRDNKNSQKVYNIVTTFT